MSQPVSMSVFFSFGKSIAEWRELGIAERELRRYRQLADRLGPVTLITYDRTDPDLPPDSGLAVAHNRWRLPQSLYSILAPLLHARTLARADVLVTHQMSGSWSAIIAHWLFRLPVVLRQGYLLGENLRRSGAGRLKRLFVSLVELAAYRTAAAVISTVPPVPVCGAPDGARVRVVPNGIDTEQFRPAATSPAAPEPGILFVGRLNAHEKNLDILIAAAHDAGLPLVLVGDGRDRDSMAALATGLGARVEFRGACPNDTIPGHMQAAGIFALPSRFEGNPKALLEAMACGLPVVTTRWQGAKEIVEDGENGLLCDADVRSLAEAFRRLAADAHLRARLGRAARETIVERYGLPRQINDEVECIAAAARGAERNV